MTAANFIKACSRSIYDRGMNVISAETWLEILNFQAGELYPEIGYRGTTSGDISDLNAEYQLSLSGSSNLENVLEVELGDADGFKFPYDNWIYNKDSKVIDLQPRSSRDPVMGIGSYSTYHIYWVGFIPEVTNISTDIVIESPKLVILQKICIKEALSRILNDHAKLDRYRTLVSRMNEYALLAMIRDYTTEIEIKKRRLVDTHPLRTF